MLIPVKCFTCGKVLGDKYEYYKRQVIMRKLENKIDVNAIRYLSTGNTSKTPEGEILDELKLNRMCCRRHMLSHVDIE